MGDALIFKCETASSNPDGSVMTYGECLLGPIRVGDAVARVVHDVDSEEHVSLTVLAVGAPNQTIPLPELPTASWGALTVRGPGADGIGPGDLLAAIPPP